MHADFYWKWFQVEQFYFLIRHRFEYLLLDLTACSRHFFKIWIAVWKLLDSLHCWIPGLDTILCPPAEFGFWTTCCWQSLDPQFPKHQHSRQTLINTMLQFGRLSVQLINSPRSSSHWGVLATSRIVSRGYDVTGLIAFSGGEVQPLKCRKRRRNFSSGPRDVRGGVRQVWRESNGRFLCFTSNKIVLQSDSQLG